MIGATVGVARNTNDAMDLTDRYFCKWIEESVAWMEWFEGS